MRKGNPDPVPDELAEELRALEARADDGIDVSEMTPERAWKGVGRGLLHRPRPVSVQEKSRLAGELASGAIGLLAHCSAEDASEIWGIAMQLVRRRSQERELLRRQHDEAHLADDVTRLKM